MKRTLCILLSLVLALTGLAALCVTANAVHNVGDIIEYGIYPQPKVTDSGLIWNIVTVCVEEICERLLE